MGPSFDKIPEIVLPPVLMTWKICLLNAGLTNVSCRWVFTPAVLPAVA